MGFLTSLWTQMDSFGIWSPKSKKGKTKNLAEHFGTPEEPKKKKKVVKKKKKAAKKKEKK